MSPCPGSGYTWISIYRTTSSLKVTFSLLCRFLANCLCSVPYFLSPFHSHYLLKEQHTVHPFLSAVCGPPELHCCLCPPSPLHQSCCICLMDESLSLACHTAWLLFMCTAHNINDSYPYSLWVGMCVGRRKQKNRCIAVPHLCPHAPVTLQSL